MVDLVDSRWALALLVFVAVALLTVALVLVGEWAAARGRRRRVSQQLERLTTEGLESLAPGAAGIFRGGDAADSLFVQRLAVRVPQLRDAKQVIDQAHLPWTVQTYLMLSLGLGMAIGAAALLLTDGWIVAAVAAFLGLLIPHSYARFRRTQRLRRFEEQFPGAVDLLGRAIRAGHPFSSGMKMVADEMQDPVAGEFRQTFEEQRFGLPIDDTLTALADRVPLVDVRIFVTALMIQREVGGNLAEILDNLSSIIRQRFTLQRQVRTLTAEGRVSMYVLTALPIGVGLFVYLTSPEYVGLLFTHPLGNAMLYTAIVLQIIGFIWMRRITNIEF